MLYLPSKLLPFLNRKLTLRIRSFNSDPISDQNLAADVQHPLNFDAQMAQMPSHSDGLNSNANDLVPADISGMNYLSYWLNGNVFDFGIPEDLN